MRLIDADEVGAEFEKLIHHAPGHDGTCYNTAYINGANDALIVIEDVETVDAVPVVRCKDCAFFKLKYRGYYGICARTNHVYTVNDFCSKGSIASEGVTMITKTGRRMKMIDEVKLAQAAEMLEKAVRLIKGSKPKDEANESLYRAVESAREVENAVRQLIKNEQANEKEKRRKVFHRRCQKAHEAIEEAMQAMRTARVMSYQCIQLSVGMGYDKDYSAICEFDDWVDDIELSCPEEGFISFDHDMYARIAKEDEDELK